MTKILNLIYSTLLHSTYGERLDFSVSLISVSITLLISVATILFTYFNTKKQIIKSRQNIFDNNMYSEFMKNVEKCFMQLQKAELAMYNIGMVLNGNVEDKSTIDMIKKEKGVPMPVGPDTHKELGHLKDLFTESFNDMSECMNKVNTYCKLMNLNKRDDKYIYNVMGTVKNDYLRLYPMIHSLPYITDVKDLVNRFNKMLKICYDFHLQFKSVKDELKKVEKSKKYKTRNL